MKANPFLGKTNSFFQTVRRAGQINNSGFSNTNDSPPFRSVIFEFKISKFIQLLMFLKSYLIRATSKISGLAKLGRIVCARKLFDEMCHRDSITWNTMLSSYSQLGLFREALSLFHLMRVSNARPDHFTFTAALSACAGAGNQKSGEKIHALAVVSGYKCSLPVNNSLIDMYGKCLMPLSASGVFEEMEMGNDISWCSMLFAYVQSNEFDAAQRVFDGMPKRVDIAWNTLIAGHARCGNVEICVGLFQKMVEQSCSPDQWTFSALMNASAESQEYCYGRMVHSLVLKSGWTSFVEVSNSILSFYAKLSCPADVVKMFDSIEVPTQVSWNAIIDAQMKVGDTQKAHLAFQQSPEKNVISWTSMIVGYARSGNGEEAISLFVDMVRYNIKPDYFSFGVVLNACSVLATIGHGKMLHSLTIHYGFHGCAYVGNGLVNMYGKCGDIKDSTLAFNDIISKDLISWNTMLLSFGLHGWASRALQIYAEMINSGIKPDNITFIALLITCSHSGLIDRGRAIFESMSSVYGLSPDLDHVACMVDMLGRGGYLEEARELAERYKSMHGVNISSSEALFGACSVHREVELGADLGGVLKGLDPQNEMSYILLSNLYCSSEQWKEAEMVRKAMLDNGVKKIPGCSWIEVKNEVTTFVAGRPSHACMEKLSSVFFCLQYEMKNPSCGSYIEGIT